MQRPCPLTDLRSQDYTSACPSAGLGGKGLCHISHRHNPLNSDTLNQPQTSGWKKRENKGGSIYWNNLIRSHFRELFHYKFRNQRHDPQRNRSLEEQDFRGGGAGSREWRNTSPRVC